ncbi:MAG: chromate transporter [Christensenellaceae bacterium]|jgi:chromate transporter|nr:chromate transporter [Christensenellaceae bacterium]
MEEDSEKKQQQQSKIHLTAEVFWVFFKLGAVTFGGGYAMLPLLSRELCEKKKWLSDEELSTLIAVAESTPGALALNSATYAGAKVSGFWGALAASVGVMLAPVAVILLISIFGVGYKDNKIVAYAFNGIRACVAALILNAAIKLTKPVKINVASLIIGLAALTLTVLSFLKIVNFDTVFIILGAAIAGLIIYSLQDWNRTKKSLRAIKDNEQAE